MMHLLGEMLMLPFSVFIYSMEMFVMTIKRMQSAADLGMDVIPGATSQPLGGISVGEGRPTEQTMAGGRPQPPGQQQAGWGDLHVQTNTSTGISTSGDTGETNQKEILKMPDRNLSDDQLKLVRYKILFVKRDYEVAFPEREDLVYDNMTGEAFTAWKVAEFIQRLDETVVPYSWRRRDYPRTFTNEEKDPMRRRDVFIQRLDERDKKYLRVYYEVLDRYVREEDEDDEVTVLKEIRNAIDRLPRNEPETSAPPRPPKS